MAIPTAASAMAAAMPPWATPPLFRKSSRSVQSIVMPSRCTRWSRIPSKLLNGTLVNESRSCRRVISCQPILSANLVTQGLRHTPLPEFQLRDSFGVHFVRTIGQTQCANIRPGASQKSILRDARTSVSLNRAVQHSQTSIRRHHFDHRDLGACFFVSHRIHHVGRFQSQKTCLLDLHARSRNVGPKGALLGQRLTKGHPRLHSLTHGFEGPLGRKSVV